MLLDCQTNKYPMHLYNLPSQTKMSGFYVVFKARCLEDNVEERGLTHLLEHLICRQFQPLMSAFSQYSIDFNAITTDDYVVFYLAGLDDYVNRYKEDFYRRLTSQLEIEEEEVKAEKAVVLQEYNSFFALPSSAIRANGLRKHFNYFGFIGQRQSIENATIETLQSLYHRRFAEPYMIINVSKTFDFHIDNPTAGGLTVPSVPLSYVDESGAASESVRNNDVIMIALKEVIPNEVLPQTQLLNHLLCGDLTSPLFHRLRAERSLCYSASLWDNVIGNQHIPIFKTEAEKRNRELVIDNFSEIINHFERYITKEMYSQAIEHFLIKREMQRISRHNNITDLFYPNLMREGMLESLTYESVIEHGMKYYADVEHTFVVYE